MLNLSHKNLDVYKISLQLLDAIYKTTNLFPKEEMYALVSQIRRAAVTVCSNLAEGAARISKKEKKRFYEISRNSLVEIDTQFEIALQQHYIKKEQITDIEKRLEYKFRILSKMIENLRKASTPH